MSINRRDFVKLIGAGLLLPSCVPSVQTPQLSGSETIYSGFRVGAPYVSKPAGLIISSEFATEKITFANEIHSILHSKKLSLKVFVSKLELLSYAQYGTGKYVEIHAEEGNYFYGHGAIDEARNVFYSTQAKITKERDDGARGDLQGWVYVHSLPDFRIVDRFPTFGNDPHDVKLIGNELYVCNGGTDSSITVIDLDNRKLVSEFKVNVPHLSLRHIEQVNDQNFIIATLTSDLKKTTPLYGLNLKTGLRAYKTPVEVEEAFMRSQLLSVCHHQGHVFASCPATHMILVWDLSGQFIGGHSVMAAAGLAVSEKLGGVIVSSGAPGEKAKIVSVENDTIRTRSIHWASGLTGSHATVVPS